MTELVFILPDGTETKVAARPGTSVMRHAKDSSIPGIDADCGGDCMCATCHVHVDPEWIDRLPPPAEQETDMLSIVDDLEPNSRLSCQIEMTDDLDGLVLHLPATHR